ncbi:MAG: RsmE family RNA methyltransferase [Myxococcaceae bacterium]
MHRAFVESHLLDQQTLDPQTLKRFKRVLRLADGELVELFDGTGRVIRGVLKSNTLTDIQILQIAPKGPVIQLYQALVSMDKLEEITQHATELGVSEIILFKSERSQVDFKDKITAKLERLTKIAQDASRQCGRSDVPGVRFGNLTPGPDLCFLTTPTAKQSLLSLLPSPVAGEGPGVRVLIGPEGGFSPQEIEKFKAAGAIEVSLAPYVLRTETAGLAALAQIQGACL